MVRTWWQNEYYDYKETQCVVNTLPKFFYVPFNNSPQQLDKVIFTTSV